MTAPQEYPAASRVSSPRVLHILGELRPSGAEVMLRCAAPLWFSPDRPHAILATGRAAGPYSDSLRRAGFEIHHIPFSKSLQFFGQVYAVLRRGRYDAVHIHTEQANLPYAVVAKLAGVSRVVHTVHANFTFTGALRRVRKLMRAGLRLLGVAEVSVGISVYENERERFSNPTTVIPNWYDDRVFRRPSRDERLAARSACGIHDDRPVIVTVGNCEPVKNHDAVLRAQQILVRTNPNWYWLHAGDEDEQQRERSLAGELGIASQCEFLGYVLNPISVLWAADVFVMPSLREGFGIAAVEAAACGLPLVLSDVAGLRDLRATLPDAVWVAPEPTAIAAAIQELYSRFRLGSEGNASCARSHFGTSAGARAYYELYTG